MTKFPHVKVRLTDEDGNAFSIIAMVSKAMRKAKVSEADIDQFKKEAMSGDYDHLLQTTMKTVDVC